LGPVDDFRIQGAFQIALLRGGQLLIENDEVGLRRLDRGGESLDFARPDERRGFRRRARLQRPLQNVGPGAPGQGLQFIQRLLGARDRRQIPSAR